MPIYEFYCPACNVLFNFFSARIDTAARPACPRCGAPRLERRPARFAMLSRNEREEEPSPFDGLDEQRMEGVMESLAAEMGDLDESEDPRQLAHLFRRFGEASGMQPGPKMEEFLGRLEAGEDPEALEAEMGEAFEGDEGLEGFFTLKQRAAAWRSARRPRRDDTLYFL